MLLTARFDDACRYAARAHAGQTAKGPAGEQPIPYMAHLANVAALVVTDGGGEDEAIAALLHDAGEDQGGEERVREIETRYGQEVAAIVRACSDTLSPRKEPWPERKARYVEHVREETRPGALRVSLADKVANSRTIRADVDRHGDRVYERFRATRDGTLWYYRSLADAFAAKSGLDALGQELENAVGELERRTPRDPAAPIHISKGRTPSQVEERFPGLALGNDGAEHEAYGLTFRVRPEREAGTYKVLAFAPAAR